MKNKLKIFIAVVLGLSMALCALSFIACGDEPKEKTVKSVSVSKVPAKTEYYVGEEFSVAGGEITVKYTDDTSEILAMDAEGVTVSEVNTVINDEDEESEEKTVTVRYGKRSANFKITVTYKKFDFTFDLGYEGAQNEVRSVRNNEIVELPEKSPVRENYTFENWYADEERTIAYDFTSAVTADTVVYAKWLENGAAYFDFSFDLNYIGSVAATVQKVKSGENAVKLSVNPERYGYEFLGWYTSAACDTEFDFSATAVTAATTVYAKWNKTLIGVKQEYVFEAEDTDLTGKTGPGLSGTSSATAMIQYSETLGASNNRFIGYQYQSGCSLEFRFLSDEAVTDAKLVLRLSAEMRDYLMAPVNYSIMLNGSSFNYASINFTNVPAAESEGVEVKALPFEDYVIAENVKLKEGVNTLKLQTKNTNALSGTTVLADAPLIDCVKVTTTAVLAWSAEHGLPKKNNY